MSDEDSYVNEEANELVLEFENNHYNPLVRLIHQNGDNDNLLPELERYSTTISELFDRVRRLPGGWVAAYLYRILQLRLDILKILDTLNRENDVITEEQYKIAMDKYNEDLIVFQGIEQEENKIIERNRLNNYIPSSCKNPPRYRKDDDFGPPPPPPLISVNGGKKSTKSNKTNKTKKSNKTNKTKKSNKTKKTKKSKK